MANSPSRVPVLNVMISNYVMFIIIIALHSNMFVVTTWAWQGCENDDFSQLKHNLRFFP